MGMKRLFVLLSLALSLIAMQKAYGELLFYDDFSGIPSSHPLSSWKVNGTTPQIIDAGNGIHQLAVNENVELVAKLKLLPANFMLESIFTLGPGELDNQSIIWNFGDSYAHGAKWSASLSPVDRNQVRVVLDVEGSKEDVTIPLDVNQPLAFNVWAENGKLGISVNGSPVVDVDQAQSPPVHAVWIHLQNVDGMAPIEMSRVRITSPPADFLNAILSKGHYIADTLDFDSNTDQVAQESLPVLKSIAEALVAHPELKLKIVGYSDSRGTRKETLELSRRRAESVKHVLVTQFQLNPDRLSAEGKGEKHFLASNKTATGRALNRRIEFIRQ